MDIETAPLPGQPLHFAMSRSISGQGTAGERIAVLLETQGGLGESEPGYVCFVTDKRGRRLFEHPVLQSEERTAAGLVPSLRIGPDGAIWVNRGTEIEEMMPPGEEGRLIEPRLKQGEQIVEFLIGGEGLWIATIPMKTEGATGIKPGKSDPRVLYVPFDADGKPAWATTLYFTRKPSFFQKGPELQIPDGWRPRVSWLPGRNPLIVAGGTLLVSFTDSDGQGLSYGLDTGTGRIRWASPVLRNSAKAAAGPDRFAIGSMGGGHFDTILFDEEGQYAEHWKTHGYCVAGSDGALRCVEITNEKDPEQDAWEALDALPDARKWARQLAPRVPGKRLVILRPGKTIERGPYIRGTQTSGAVADRAGRVAFWREGQLTTIDPDLTRRLHHTDERKPGGRWVLGEDGALIGCVGQELWRIEDLMDPPPRAGSWCDDGNGERNPVFEGESAFAVDTAPEKSPREERREEELDEMDGADE
ncbi:MAG: hypothetical protein RLY93_18185 [Sumerlaeia bacterium]